MTAPPPPARSASVADLFARRRLAGAVAATAFALLLAGCARPLGDFDRAQPSVLNDSLMPAAGNLRALAVGQPRSAFNLSDEEQRMRDVVWRFLTSGRTRDWFFDVAVELRRTGIAAGPSARPSIDRYYNWLHSARYQSSSVRYATLADDIGADLATLPASFAAICAVETVERQRVTSAANLPDVGDAARADISARHAENDEQVAWFVRAVRYRYDSYNYALDHLLVETPADQAKGVDATLAALGQGVDRAESGAFCGHDGAPGPIRPVTAAVPSRFSSNSRGETQAKPAAAPAAPAAGS
jgi:hypothetical protein